MNIMSVYYRSRSSASQRYDGYVSDTAAFDANAFIDEVDYRRPLHVQTPHNRYKQNKNLRSRSIFIYLIIQNIHYRSSDRNYHTITTTSTITQNERPFVSIKRAHEQAKLSSIGVSFNFNLFLLIFFDIS